jgi:nucleotide-binding universal stress UspA family protein
MHTIVGPISLGMPPALEGSMFRNILVAVDGSKASADALTVAIDLAQKYKATIHLLHAFPHVSDLLGTPQYEALLVARSQIGEALLESMRTQVGDLVPVMKHLVEGPPAEAILRIAEQDGHDLIVLGSRGHGQLAGLLLGSVSNVVAQRATCPVMIVHGVPEARS